MWELLKKYRLVIGACTICLMVLVFYSLNLRHKREATALERTLLGVLAPLAGGAASTTQGIDRMWSDYIDLVNVREENKKLRASVTSLNGRIMANQEAILANERLKKLLQLKDAVQAPALAASVIGEDGSPWFRTLIIDRGEEDGLREGMAVVAAGGVVGQVVKVAAGSSRVLLLTDHASGIAAIVQRSRARGVVKGKGGDRCSLEFTVREDDVKVGDIVITSGIGQIFPKGYPIGEVTMVKKGDYGIFQTIEIRPAVNLMRIEEVLILVKQPHD